MRQFCFFFILILLSACGNHEKDASKDDLVYPSQGLFATDYKYLFFGKLGSMQRSFQEDTLLFPPIDGLVHMSAYAFCPTDTCVAEYATLALRCPPIAPLLDWVADTVSNFAHSCPIGGGLRKYNGKNLSIPKKDLESDEEICKYYIDHLRHTYDNWHCTGEGDHGVLNEQAGLLLADSWHTGDLHTFYRIDWYDWMSCGNNTRESWWTVDATTGKLLSLSDFILPDKQDALTALMMPRIVNGKREKLIKQYPTYIAEAKDLLKRADGCALIPEGLVIFFYPYNLGTGADGEYEAVIPFEELNEILKQPILKMVSITE